MRPARPGWTPTQETVQTYLIGLCRELADLGFDEILFTHCAYPTQGETDTLRDTAEREAALATFCRRLQGALADEDVTLSIQGQGDSGSPDAPSGQTTGLWPPSAGCGRRRQTRPPWKPLTPSCCRRSPDETRKRPRAACLGRPGRSAAWGRFSG